MSQVDDLVQGQVTMSFTADARLPNLMYDKPSRVLNAAADACMWNSSFVPVIEAR